MNDYINVLSLLTKAQCDEIAELMAHYRKPLPEMLVMLIDAGIGYLQDRQRAEAEVERARQARADI